MMSYNMGFLIVQTSLTETITLCNSKKYGVNGYEKGIYYHKYQSNNSPENEVTIQPENDNFS